jgi:hypothetical protein
MKFFASCIACAALAAIASAAPALAQDSSLPDGQAVITINSTPLTPGMAPADEYFGHSKLSNLGVRNIIHAFAVEGNSPLALPMQRGRIEEVRSALNDWAGKYPRDPWLRRDVFNFAIVLSAKNDPATSAATLDALLQAAERYQHTPFGSRAEAMVRAMYIPSSVDYTADDFVRPGPFDLNTLPDTLR